MNSPGSSFPSKMIPPLESRQQTMIEASFIGNFVLLSNTLNSVRTLFYSRLLKDSNAFGWHLDSRVKFWQKQTSHAERGFDRRKVHVDFETCSLSQLCLSCFSQLVPNVTPIPIALAFISRKTQIHSVRMSLWNAPSKSTLKCIILLLCGCMSPANQRLRRV